MRVSECERLIIIHKVDVKREPSKRSEYIYSHDHMSYAPVLRLNCEAWHIFEKIVVVQAGLPVC